MPKFLSGLPEELVKANGSGEAQEAKIMEHTANERIRIKPP